VRLARRSLALLAWLAAAGALASHAVSAHSGLLLSDPLDGATLGASPEGIRLLFSEAAEPSLSDIRVTDTQGVSYHVGRPGRVADDPLALSVRVRPLDRGVYLVDWRIVSAVDGHATSGTYAFGVRADPSAAKLTASARASVSWIEVSARWMFVAGLFLLMGATFAGMAGFGGNSELRLAVVGLVAASAGVVLLFVVQRGNSAAPIQALFRTFIGRALIWRAAALAAVAVSLVVARASSRTRRIAMAAAAVATLACAGVHVAAGHAAAAGLLPPTATVFIQLAHFAAGGIWLGGLAALLIGVRGEPSESKAAAVRRFSTVAAIGLLVVVATGVVRAIGELSSWGDLIATTYGRALSIKVGLTVVVATLGGVNRWRSVVPAPTSLRSLRRFGGGELLVAAAVLAAAAVLTTAPPPAAAERSPSGLVAAGVDYGTTVRVNLRAASDQPGPNRYKLQVVDYDSKRRVDATRVSLRFVSVEDPSAPHTSLALAPVPDGSYVGSGANLAFDGRWRVFALIERGESSVEVPLELETRRVVQDVSIARIPGKPPTYTVEVKRTGLVRVSPVPEREGDSKLYVTCYSILNDERAVASITVATEAEDGSRRQLTVRRLSASRFEADAVLVRGRNRIVIVAKTSDGMRMRAGLDLHVPPQ
jgi:copper transport protein